jgi:hypothetical protein
VVLLANSLDRTLVKYQRMTGPKPGAHRIRVENIGKGDATVLFLGLISRFYLRY